MVGFVADAVAVVDRPMPPAGDVPAGHEWVVEEAGPEWQLASSPQVRCRHTSKAVKCGETASVTLNRGRWDAATGTNHDSWWAYCCAHSWGRWVEDGRVVTWALRLVGGDA